MPLLHVPQTFFSCSLGSPLQHEVLGGLAWGIQQAYQCLLGELSAVSKVSQEGTKNSKASNSSRASHDILAKLSMMLWREKHSQLPRGPPSLKMKPNWKRNHLLKVINTGARSTVPVNGGSWQQESPTAQIQRQLMSIHQQVLMPSSVCHHGHRPHRETTKATTPNLRARPWAWSLYI